MKIPSKNHLLFYRIDESMSVRWMHQGMLVTRRSGRKRYYSYADWVCIRSCDAHHLGMSVAWSDLAVIMPKATLKKKLAGTWRGSNVQQVGPVQLAKRRRLRASPLFHRDGFEDEL